VELIECKSRKKTKTLQQIQLHMLVKPPQQVLRPFWTVIWENQKGKSDSKVHPTPIAPIQWEIWNPIVQKTL